MLRAQWQPWYAGLSFIWFEPEQDGKISVADPITIRLVEKDAMPAVKPMLTLRKDEAQVLMDDLWNCGIRPTDRANDVGELRATKEHLKDMQRIVFNGKIRGDK